MRLEFGLLETNSFFVNFTKFLLIEHSTDINNIGEKKTTNGFISLMRLDRISYEYKKVLHKGD